MEKDLNRRIEDNPGDPMVGKRQGFVLVAFLAGILIFSGVFSAIVAYIGGVFGQRFVLISGGLAAILLIVGLYLLYYALREI